MIPKYNFESIMNAIKYEIAEGFIDYDKDTGQMRLTDNENTVPSDIFEGLESIFID